jgi:hypothetical protein
MIRAETRCVLVAVLGASLMVLGGCGASRMTQIQDSWLDTVPREKQWSVGQHRDSRQRALNELARADAAIKDAEPQLNTARLQVEAASLRREGYEKLLEADRITGPQLTIQQSEGRLRSSETKLAAAEAEVRWCKENLSAWRAEKQLWERELQLADVELNYARYKALKEQGDPRVAALTDQDFLAELAEVKEELAEARSDADSQKEKARQARAQWQQLAEVARGYLRNGTAALR